MKTKIAALAAAAALVLVVGARVAQSRRAAGKPPERRDDAALVAAARVVRGDVEERIALTGSVRPRNEVEVFAKVSGRVEWLGANVGDRVKQGQKLAVIEHEEIGWQARSAEAAMAVAKANLAGAELDWHRARTLFEGGSAPQAQVDAAQVKVDLARAQVAQAEAAAGLAAQQLANASPTAPVSGTVTRRPVNLGVQVGLQSPLFTVQDLSALKLESSVDAAAFARLSRRARAVVTVDARPGERFEGQVTLLSPALDAQTRRATVEVEIDNASGRLLPNTFARAEIRVGKLDGALVVPRDAVLEAAGGAVVYRIRDGKAEAVRPELGARDGERVVVRSGLADGDLVAVSGLGNLADGAPVKVAEPPGTAVSAK
jgi:RND family efflux transporter MFP subunit